MLARGDLRKLPPLEGPFRIVQMQGIEFNACGGTHVQTTGAIGSILLRRVEKVRQGWRVEFVCGLRAVRSARRDYTLSIPSPAPSPSPHPTFPPASKKSSQTAKHAIRNQEATLRARTGGSV